MEPTATPSTSNSTVTAPRLWVSRFVLLRDLGSRELVRDVRLHAGLNIIWGQSGGLLLGGHSVGKTLFCKLLRFGLGEEIYDDEAFEKRIERVLPGAYLGLEVSVDGDLWCVLRPMCRMHKVEGKRAHQRRPDGALKGGKIEDAASTLLDQVAFKSYTDALDALKDRCLSRGFGKDDVRPFTWPELLQWFARDQETRFQEQTVFRSHKSRTSNPIDSARSDLLVRTALGLVDAEETKVALELQKFRKQLEDAASKNREAERLLRAGALLLTAMEEGSTKSPVDYKALQDSGDLFFIPERIEKEKKGYEKELSKAEERFRNEDTAVNSAWEKYANAKDTLEGTETLLKAFREAKDPLAAKMAAAERALERRYKKKDHICPDCLEFYGDSKVLERLGKMFKELAQAAPERRKQIEAELEEEKTALLSQLEEHKVLHKEAKGVYEDAVAARAGTDDTIRSLRVMIEVAARKLRDAKAYVQGAEAAREGKTSTSPLSIIDTKQLKDDIGELSDKLLELRDAKKAQLDEVRTAFTTVIEDFLGKPFRGEIVEQEGHLKFHLITGRGQQGEAVETLTVLLADLCALKMAIDGKTSLPGLLVHDSPREADLDKAAYDKLFEYIEVLADKCEQRGHIPFQYIITTTTPPPEKYTQDDAEEVVLKLSAAEEGDEGLLLKTVVEG